MSVCCQSENNVLKRKPHSELLHMCNQSSCFEENGKKAWQCYTAVGHGESAHIDNHIKMSKHYRLMQTVRSSVATFNWIFSQIKLFQFRSLGILSPFFFLLCTVLCPPYELSELHVDIF